jgi:GT2 family glycosyltransferase
MTNYPEVDVIRLFQNQGYSNAINTAMNFIKSEYVVFLNNDITVDPNWLRELIFQFKTKKKIAALTPKILFLRNRETLNSAGGNCDLFGIGWNRGNGELDNNQYNTVDTVFYANGAALLTKTEIWNDIGPFDPCFFLYGEDLDWCWRARLKGYEILYVPSSVIYHSWQGSNSPIIPLLEKHWTTIFLKNYSLKTILKLLVKYVPLKLLKSFWLLKYARNIDEKSAVLKSFFWNLRSFKLTWLKHIAVQSSRKVSDDEIQKYMVKNSFELLAWLNLIPHPLLETLRNK